MLWAQSTTKDYIRAEQKLQSIWSCSFYKSCLKKHFFFLAYLYSAGVQHGNLHPARWSVLFCWPTQEPSVSHSQHRKNRGRFWKKCRWMDRKGRKKEEIPGSKRSIDGYTLTYSRLRLNCVFSPDGTLICASAAPHCGAAQEKNKYNYKVIIVNMLW